MKNLFNSCHQSSHDNSDRSSAASPLSADLLSHRRSEFGAGDLVDYTDDELLHLAACGDSDRPAALRELLERYEPSAFMISNLLLESRADAAAASEDACVDAICWLQAEAVESASKFRLTLYRLVRRHCAEYSLMTRPGANSEHRDYRAFLSGLRERDRWMVALRFVAGLSREEIAEVLELPADEVKSALWAAMQRLMRIGIAEGLGFPAAAADRLLAGESDSNEAQVR